MAPADRRHAPVGWIMIHHPAAIMCAIVQAAALLMNDAWWITIHPTIYCSRHDAMEESMMNRQRMLDDLLR